MGNDKPKRSLRYLTKSKFIRSVFLRVLPVLIFVIAAVIGIVFYSYTSELNSNNAKERQKQLDEINTTVSRRMEEVSSIAYNISVEKAFPIQNAIDVEAVKQMLSAYLVGNDFIEHLAYYRLSEPEIIYVPRGALNFNDFWKTYLNVDKEVSDAYVQSIQQSKDIYFQPVYLGSEEKSFFAYVCPLPMMSSDPQAFVMMLIPFSKFKPVMEMQLSNCNGSVAVYNENGNEIYKTSNLSGDFTGNLLNYEAGSIIRHNGKKYVVQKSVSTSEGSNGWTYVSAICLSDMTSGTGKQYIFIILLVALLIIGIVAILISVFVQYRPISKLAMALNDDENLDGTVIDEGSVLSNTFATLKDDSEQKQKYQTAYYEAEAANKAKSAFFSNMSHDIRTPMNAIIGMTEIAKSHFDDPEYVKECLQNVTVASKYLLDIINNVLDMSRIESGRFSLAEEEIDFPKLVNEMVTILNSNVAAKKQKFIIETKGIIDEKVYGDTVRLTQVFMNILSNAVKFTPDGGTITFIMNQSSSADGYGDYEFVFKDTGIGMSPEFTKKIFDSFSRDDNASIAQIEGTGLGMAIAKSFVELMGGTIKCDSVLNKGTTITVNLRMKLSENEDSKKNTRDYKGTSVLIVGEDKQICDNQSALFSEFDIIADYAYDTSVAVDMVSKKDYQFIIINQAYYDERVISSVKSLKAAARRKDCYYVLAVRDVLSVDQSAIYDTGVATSVQIPFFKSTVAGILNKSFKRVRTVKRNEVVDMTGMRVLLAEDNKINREIAKTLISATKADITETANGKEALEAYLEHEVQYFDLILMDIQMPVMDGYEATAAIRTSGREDARTIPIVAMTANTFEEDVRRVKEAKMDGHLGKPYTANELYRVLGQIKNMKY